MFGVLQPPASSLLAEERAALGDLREVLAAGEAPADTLAILRQATADLDSVFLLVVVGEFNAGKSAFVNALLRDDVLREGVTPTTAAVTLVSHGAERRERQGSDGLVQVTAPSPILQDLRLVDTPGTNAILRHHERLTQEFVPRSDLVLFVTSADRPFTESERAFLAEIRSWGRKVVFALNKVDLLGTPDDLRAQLDFVAAGVRQLLGFEPEIFPVSARRARAALDVADPTERARQWEASGFAALEGYLQRTLDDIGRVRLKLLSPLGVAERILADQRAATTARLAVLRDDLRTSEQIERLLDLYVKDARRDFEPRLADLENVIRQMSERGTEFFEDTVRLGRIWDLFKAERIRTEFERDVVADSAEQIDRRVQDMIDWLVEQDVRLWRSISSELDRRRAAGADPARSAVSGPFEVDRRAVLQGVAGRAREVLQRHDHHRQAQEIGTAMREAVTQASLFQAGAVGLGAATVALVSSVAADVTGLLAAGVLAGVGLFILPMRKRRAQAEFRERTDELRERLTESMREELNRQLDASVQRVRDAVAPYDRFVRAERDRLDELEATLDRFGQRFTTLRAGIELLGTSTADGAAHPAEPAAST
ncbi:MAG: dynamin family protein, partial [Chloroflexota bacterium]|nr:dynamin family protein [Chloroflexota bacterium]